MATVETRPVPFRLASGARRQRQVRRALLLLWPVGLSAVFVFPFVVMLTTGFKGVGEIFTAPPTLLPEHWTFSNFAEAFDAMPFWRYLANTLVVAGLSVLGTTLSCPAVAYTLSKVRWFGARPLLTVVLMTMMLPPQVTLVPVFLIWNGLGAVGTYLPLIVPAFLGTPFLIFMIRQFLMNVPDELIEAARIDGASELRTYVSIVLPIARPAIVTAGVLQFVWSWTDFLNPLIYLSRPEQYTLSIGLYSFFGQHDVAWGPLMAACVMFTLPALVIFLVGQRFFIGGISAGALK